MEQAGRILRPRQRKRAGDYLLASRSFQIAARPGASLLVPGQTIETFLCQSVSFRRPLLGSIENTQHAH